MANPDFWQGVEAFNQQSFYACHDILEALWLEAPEPEKTFYQGILQIAVGCYHLGNHNWRGSVILLGEGIRRLHSYQPTYEEIDVGELVAQSLHLLQGLQKIDPEELVEFVQKLQGNQEKAIRDRENPSYAQANVETVYSLPKIRKINP